jgi:hypothetical protein
MGDWPTDPTECGLSGEDADLVRKIVGPDALYRVYTAYDNRDLVKLRAHPPRGPDLIVTVGEHRHARNAWVGWKRLAEVVPPRYMPVYHGFRDTATRSAVGFGYLRSAVEAWEFPGDVEAVVREVFRALHGPRGSPVGVWRPTQLPSLNPILPDVDPDRWARITRAYDRCVGAAANEVSPHATAHLDLHLRNILVMPDGHPILVDTEHVRADGPVLHDYAKALVSCQYYGHGDAADWIGNEAWFRSRSCPLTFRALYLWSLGREWSRQSTEEQRERMWAAFVEEAC